MSRLDSASGSTGGVGLNLMMVVLSAIVQLFCGGQKTETIKNTAMINTELEPLHQ